MILKLISSIVSPVTNLIDELHTSDEEKLKIKAELAKLEHEAQLKALDFEKERLKSQAKIITAEAQGASWLQRSWRPITMLTFLVLVVCDGFGVLRTPLAPQAWTLLQIGLGGYVAGRSGEKIVKLLKDKQ